MSTEKLKKSDAGEVFLGTLTKRARAAMERTSAGPLAAPPPAESVDDDAEAAGAAFVLTLTKAAQKALTKGRPAAPAEPEVQIEGNAVPKYGIVECQDGEWAQLRTFKNAEGLARRLQQLEGQDVVVWCFYGVPLAVTKGPQRYLELPGGVQKIQVPMFEGGPCKVVDADLLGKQAVQEDGYIGPPELATAMPVEETVKPTGGGDDDDDDE